MYAGHSPTAKVIHEGFSWEVEVFFKYLPFELRHLCPKAKLHRRFTFRNDKEAAYYLFNDIIDRDQPCLRHVRIVCKAPKLKNKEKNYNYKAYIMQTYPLVKYCSLRTYPLAALRP